MRYLTIFLIFLFCVSESKSQNINPKDPNEWEYKIFPGNEGSLQDSAHAFEVVEFYSNFKIIESVIDTNSSRLRKKGIRYATIRFQVFKLQDLSYCLGVAKKIKDTSSCQLNQGVGDYFIAGDYVFINMEDCFPCIIQKNSKDMCKPFIESLFKRIDHKEDLKLKDLLIKLPIKEAM